MRWTEPGLALAMAGLAGAFGQITQPAAPQAPKAPAPMQALKAPAPALQRFVVVLDAAHGGSDPGAQLGDGVAEKDLVLTLAEHLQAMLQKQGLSVTMTRNADIDLPGLNRAEIANHAQAEACLVIHATATGSGVHLFTSSLSSHDASIAGVSARTLPNQPAILPWETAQAAYSTDSLKLESELDAALVHAEIPVTMGRASVQPMDSLACPAVAVELAPLAAGNTTKGRPITDERYQTTVEGALAAAIGSWRTDRMER